MTKVTVDIPFYVNPALLSLLVRDFSRKLSLTVSLIASDAEIKTFVNNKLLGEDESTSVGADEAEIFIELDYKAVTVYNILRIQSETPTKFIGLKFINMDII